MLQTSSEANGSPDLIAKMELPVRPDSIHLSVLSPQGHAHTDSI